MSIGTPLKTAGLNLLGSPLNAKDTTLLGTIRDGIVYSVLQNTSKLAQLGAYKAHDYQSNPSQFIRIGASNKLFGSTFTIEGQEADTISGDTHLTYIGKGRYFNNTWEQFDTALVSQNLWQLWTQSISTMATQLANELDLVWYGLCVKTLLQDTHTPLNAAKNGLMANDNVLIDASANKLLRNGISSWSFDNNGSNDLFMIPRFVKQISKYFAELIDSYTTKGVPLSRVKIAVSKTFSQAIEEAYSVRGRAPQYIQQDGDNLMVVDGHTLYVDAFLGKDIKVAKRERNVNQKDAVSKDIFINLKNIHLIAFTPEVNHFYLSKQNSGLRQANSNRIKDNLVFEMMYGASTFPVFVNRLKFVIDGTTGALFDCKKSIEAHGNYRLWKAKVNEAGTGFVAGGTNDQDAKGNTFANFNAYKAELAKQTPFLDVQKHFDPGINQKTGKITGYQSIPLISS